MPSDRRLLIEFQIGYSLPSSSTSDGYIVRQLMAALADVTGAEITRIEYPMAVETGGTDAK